MKTAAVMCLSPEVFLLHSGDKESRQKEALIQKAELWVARKTNSTKKD